MYKEKINQNYKFVSKNYVKIKNNNNYIEKKS